MANYRYLVVLLVLGTRLSGQPSPIKDFISNYYEQLNNLGDVGLSMAERRLFRAEILNSYFMFDGSLVWNDLRPRGSERVVNPGGPPSGSSRVHRGGLDDDLRVSRVSYRLGDDPTHRHSYLGFRLARSSQ